MSFTEGYWWSETMPWFPMPQPYVGPWFDRERFLDRLKFIEERCQVIAYKGPSPCRLCGCSNGSEEYQTGEWRWPAGLRHYIEVHNVRPSTHFEKLILGDDYADHTRYREWYNENVIQPKLAKIREDDGN